jgi:hypothetical protein
MNGVQHFDCAIFGLVLLHSAFSTRVGECLFLFFILKAEASVLGRSLKVFHCEKASHSLLSVRLPEAKASVFKRSSKLFYF